MRKSPRARLTSRQRRFEAATRDLARRYASGRAVSLDELAHWIAATYAILERGPNGQIQTVEEITDWIAETYPELGLDD